MKHDGQIDCRTLTGECRAAIAEYCCCDVCGMETYPCGACVDNLDWVDTYEICLDVAKRVNGERAMTWDEFLSFRDCVTGLMQGSAQIARREPDTLTNRV